IQRGAQSGIETVVMEDTAMMLVHTSSNEYGWNYIAIVPKNVVMSRVNELKLWAELLLVLYLFGGIAVCYGMAYRNYNPIREIVRTIVSGGNRPWREAGNEYDLMKQTFTRSIRQEQHLLETISRQTPIIRANFLTRLVRGQVDAAALTEDMLEDMGIRFPFQAFALILLDLDPNSAFVKEDTEREWAQVRFIVMNVGEELANQCGFTVELDRRRLALLLTVRDSKEERPVAEASIRQLIAQLKETLERQFRIRATIAASQIQYGMDRIGTGYDEALLALEYRIVQGRNAVIYYEDTKDTEQGDYYYPLEFESRLINYAKNGDYASIEQLLDHIYEFNFVSHHISPDAGKYLFFDMTGTLLKLMPSLQHKGELPEGLGLIRRMLDCQTAADMLQNTKDGYKKLTCAWKETRTDHHEALFIAAKRYAEDHY
ncbi:MAG: hypothetical protein J7559_23645, partial [Cohnella sp.]|nr:hypothetical protein [Cohnella sp.]